MSLSLIMADPYIGKQRKPSSGLLPQFTPEPKVPYYGRVRRAIQEPVIIDILVHRLCHRKALRAVSRTAATFHKGAIFLLDVPAAMMRGSAAASCGSVEAVTGTGAFDKAKAAHSH
jgi:hypothetical protein